MKLDSVLVVILSIGVLIFVFLLGSDFRTGRAISNFGNDADNKILIVGDQFESDLVINLDEGDSISSESSVVVAITKSGVVVEAKTISFREFIELSDNPIKPIHSEGVYYYQIPGTYIAQLSDVIQFTFNDVGEYDVTIIIVDEGVDINKKFVVNE